MLSQQALEHVTALIAKAELYKSQVEKEEDRVHKDHYMAICDMLFDAAVAIKNLQVEVIRLGDHLKKPRG